MVLKPQASRVMPKAIAQAKKAIAGFRIQMVPAVVGKMRTVMFGYLLGQVAFRIQMVPAVVGKMRTVMFGYLLGQVAVLMVDRIGMFKHLAAAT